MTDRKHKRVAIVAGVGPGLGAALVHKLAKEGCCVGMFARSPEFISKLAAELGADVLAVPTDVSDAKQVAAGFRSVRQQLGPVQILIAHASGSVGMNSRNHGASQLSALFSVRVKPCRTCLSAARAQ